MTTLSARIWMWLAIVPILAVGCATAALPPPTALQPGDLARLGGNWEWTSWPETPARLGAGPIRVRLADGRLQFESPATSGNLALHEGSGTRVLRGEARDRVGGGRFVIQLTQRAGATPRAAGAQQALVLLVVEQ